MLDPRSCAKPRAVPAGGARECRSPGPQRCAGTASSWLPLHHGVPSVIISFGSHVRSVSWQRPKESQHILNISFLLCCLPPSPKKQILGWKSLSAPWAQAVHVSALASRQVLRGPAGLVCGDGAGLVLSGCCYPSPIATRVEDKQH